MCVCMCAEWTSETPCAWGNVAGGGHKRTCIDGVCLCMCMYVCIVRE